MGTHKPNLESKPEGNVCKGSVKKSFNFVECCFIKSYFFIIRMDKQTKAYFKVKPYFKIKLG